MKKYKSDKNREKKAKNNIRKFNEKILINDDMSTWCKLHYEYKYRPIYFTQKKKEMLDRLTKHLKLEKYLK